MPMIKASKICNKLSLSPSVILVKRQVCLCLNPPSITCMHIHVDKYILNVHKVVNSCTKGRIPIFISNYSYL